jgi:GTP cyclohydrolase I
MSADANTNGRKGLPYVVDAAAAAIDGDLPAGYSSDEPQMTGKLEGLRFQSNPAIEGALTTILGAIGEDPQREGLRNTPSLCEHHMLPFYGHAHVAYMPQGKVIGLSKIPRIVEMYARRLQVQERMTVEIADFIDHHLSPAGVAVVCEGVHLCSVMRGVRKENASMVTSAMRGTFRSDSKTRGEFLELIRSSRHHD